MSLLDHPDARAILADSVLTAEAVRGCDDRLTSFLGRYLPRFRDAPPPDPDRGDWSAWQDLLADRGPAAGDPREAMCIVTDGEYGTVSSSLVALPRHVIEPLVYLHADGRPGEAPFQAVPAHGPGRS